MKTIKVIDLLNKIAKGEEVPKRIKYDDKNWNYKDEIKKYVSDDTYFCFSNFEFDELNDEVEIIEEPQEHKIPEKLKCAAWGDKDENGNYLMSAIPSNEMLMNKINEIIDCLEEINKEDK